LWEILKDRFAGWANNQIDEKAPKIMNDLWHFVEMAASYSLGWTISVAILILIIIFLHSYFTESKPAVLDDPKSLPETLSIRDVLSYIEHDTTWNSKREPEFILFDIAETIEAAARKGYLSISGHKQFSAEYEQIEPYFWNDNGIDVNNITRTNKGNGRTKRINLSVPSPIYEGLTVDRNEVETLWPPKARVGERHEPAIRMSVGEGGPYSDTGSAPGIRRTCNLKLENVGSKATLSNCSVHILEVRPKPDGEGPWLLKDKIVLAAGAHMFIPLVTYGEPSDPKRSGDSYATMETEKGRPTLEVGPQYTVFLRATAPEVAHSDLNCMIWVDEKKRLRIEKAGGATTDKPGSTPLNPGSLFAYVNGQPRVRGLDKAIADKLGKEFRDYSGERASLNELLPRLGIKSIKQLDDLLAEKSDLILLLCAYAVPEGAIEKGHSLEVLTWVLGAELGAERFYRILDSCKYNAASRKWVDGIVKAYHEIVSTDLKD
jgi:hypothetical protein